MEKYITTKNFRRLAAAATALLFLAVFALPAMAEYVDGYIPNVANVNSELSEVSQTQADNLYIALMNRMYPVGSVYMTTSTSLDTVAKMEAHFGGEWVRWSQGTVPLGGGADIGTASMDGLINANVRVSDLLVNVPALTNGGVSLGTPTVTWNANVAGWNHNHPGSYSKTLSIAEMPQHNHNPVTVSAAWSSDLGKGTGSSPWWADKGGGTAHALYFVVGDVVGTVGQAFNVKTSFPLNTNSIIPSINGRSGTVNGQSINANGAHQSVGTNTLNVTGSGAATVGDATVQPFITCYMYERRALANLK